MIRPRVHLAPLSRVRGMCIAAGITALATTVAEASLYGHTVSITSDMTANPWWPEGRTIDIGEFVAGEGVEYTYSQTVWDYGDADDPDDDVVSALLNGYIDIGEHSISWGINYTNYLYDDAWLAALPCEFSGYTFDVLSAASGFITDASFNFDDHLEPTGYITDHVSWGGDLQDWASSWWTDPSDPSRLAMPDGTSLAMNHQGYYWGTFLANPDVTHHLGWTIDLTTVPGPATLPLLTGLMIARRRRARN